MPRHTIPSNLLAAARSLRRDETPAEAKLWNSLRARRLDGARFKRQAVIGTYIADFYCPNLRLIVELDGRVHDQPDVKLNDHIRQKNLGTEGFTVLRFTNDQVDHDLDTVLTILRRFIASR